VARPPRINVPNGIYHVTSRGNRRQPVFLDDRDRDVFLGMLATLGVRRRWRCHGYCLMPNHYHLVIETPQADLSSGMQFLNGGYADHFNFRHRMDGHLFQGRFHAVLVETDPHLAELSRYLALNPVRAGLAAGARGWRWSSYPAIAEGRPSPPFVDVDAILGLFGRDPERARRSFVDFVEGPGHGDLRRASASHVGV
jgi:REP element-mobilizing transposase RayT